MKSLITLSIVFSFACHNEVSVEPLQFEFDDAVVSVIETPEGLTAVLTERGSKLSALTMTWDRETHESQIVFGELLDEDHLDGLTPEKAARFLYSSWRPVALVGGPERYAEQMLELKLARTGEPCAEEHNNPEHPDFGKCGPTSIVNNCCKAHDSEYWDNCCDMSSWLPFVGSRECNRANRKLVVCFIRRFFSPGDGHERTDAPEVGVGMQEFLDRYWGPMEDLQNRLDCHFDISCDL